MKDCASTFSVKSEPGRPEHAIVDSAVYRPKVRLRACRKSVMELSPFGQRFGSGTIFPSGPRCADQPSSDATSV